MIMKRMDMEKLKAELEAYELRTTDDPLKGRPVFLSRDKMEALNISDHMTDANRYVISLGYHVVKKAPLWKRIIKWFKSKFKSN